MNVILDRRGCEPQPSGNFAVRETGGDAGRHLALARSQHIKPVGAACPRHAQQHQRVTEPFCRGEVDRQTSFVPQISGNR